MKLYVGVTDNKWFDFLRHDSPDEVNFWRPGGTRSFKVLSPGEIFLFKLHSPHDFIVGGGVFTGHSLLPLRLAWDAFDRKNGAADFASFSALVLRHRRDDNPNPVIGCIILNQPFFFSEQDWIQAPSDWAKNIVGGKGYDTDETVGRRLWEQVAERLAGGLPMGEDPRSTEYLAKARLGQGAFRVMVTDAYSRRCAITGERTLPVLEAAHIRPYAAEGPMMISNGLCMRADLHILFDRGYLTVTNDYHVEVSTRIREEFENGRDYYAHHGQALASLPSDEILQPSKEFIQWHNEHVYVA